MLAHLRFVTRGIGSACAYYSRTRRVWDISIRKYTRIWVWNLFEFRLADVKYRLKHTKILRDVQQYSNRSLCAHDIILFLLDCSIHTLMWWRNHRSEFHFQLWFQITRPLSKKKKKTFSFQRVSESVNHTAIRRAWRLIPSVIRSTDLKYT